MNISTSYRPTGRTAPAGIGLAALFALAAMCSSPARVHAQPTLVAAAQGLPTDTTLDPLALDGPIDTQIRRNAAGILRLRLDFDDSVIAFRTITVEPAGEVIYFDHIPGLPNLTIDLAGYEDAEYLTVSLEDVVSPTGVLERAEVRAGIIPGDLNNDRKRDFFDQIALLTAFDSGLSAADWDESGAIDDADITAFISEAGGAAAALPDESPRVLGSFEMFAPTGEASRPLSLTIRDDRLLEDTISVDVVSLDPAVLPTENISVTRNGGTLTLTIEGAPGATGMPTALMLLDDGESVTEAPIAVTIRPDTPPSVRVTTDTYLGTAPLTVRFDATGTTDELKNIAAYGWDFGDGASASGANAEHTFTTPGEYTVLCTVTDDSGLIGTAERTITVASPGYSHAGPVSEAEARRFLWQAAFGPSDSDVADVMQLGYEAWIDQQFAMPASFMTQQILEDGDAMNLISNTSPREIFDDYAVQAPDQLRQRSAWALLQIIVNNLNANGGDNIADALYYNFYIESGLGNYRQLLSDVTFSYQMGRYLTYDRNRKENPSTGSKPDENYAREVQQLFTIGLTELNLDGSPIIDIFGDAVPTYDNEDVIQFARVYTGLRRDGDDRIPMTTRPSDHEFGAKQFHDYPGAVPADGLIPATDAETDQGVIDNINLSLDNLFYHPACPPFISHLLIQRFTSSNPTPAYVARVAEAFSGSGPYGTGVRGDMAATMKAILLDPEARDPAYRNNPLYGKVLEPYIQSFGIYRILERIDHPDRPYPYQIDDDDFNAIEELGQSFMRSPSVFNFYLPDYAPPESFLDRSGMVAPELQILDDVTAFEKLNYFLDENIRRTGDDRSPLYDQFKAQSGGDNALLVDLVAAEFLHEPLDPTVRQIIIDTVSMLSSEDERVRTAVQLMVSQPSFSILR